MALIIFSCSCEMAQGTSTRNDSLVLPFNISEKLRLTTAQLADKKEGYFARLLPIIALDPTTGFQYGINAEIYANNRRSDPFFQYTPYRSYLSLEASTSINGQRELVIDTDFPYLFNTTWRGRIGGYVQVDPTLLYFGLDARSIRDPLETPNSKQTFTRYDNYTAALDNRYPFAGSYLTNHYYNHYTKQQHLLYASGEKVFLDGKIRLLLGATIAWTTISTFDGTVYANATDPSSGQELPAANGPTRLQTDFDAGVALGYGKTRSVLLQTGICYDTRKFESNPISGLFIELTHQLSLSGLGASYRYYKLFLNARGYQSFSVSKNATATLAARIGIGYTGGRAPFFEYQRQWSSDGELQTIGGENTLRGYKQNRFAAPVVTFSTLEVRYPIFKLNAFRIRDDFRYHFTVYAVPFFDVGGVASQINNLLDNHAYKCAYGTGGRIIWDQTVVRLDYAVSPEDRQFFLALGHTF